MLIYNVTVKVDSVVHDEWLRWMREVHISDVLATGMFVRNQLCRVQLDEADGITYAVQYYCENRELLERYYREFAPVLQKKHTERYKGKFAAFRTVLEVL